MSVVAHLERGVLAGVAAGVVFGLFLALVATPLVGFADGTAHDSVGGHGADAEGSQTDSHHRDGGQTAVDAETNDRWSLTTLVSVVSGLLWAILLGGLVFGAAYYLLEPAIPGTDGTRSYVLAGGGFVTVSGAPWLVLPPQPPGTEQALSTDLRLALYAGMMVAGALACLLSWYSYGRLRPSRGPVVAALVSLLPFAVLPVVALLAPGNGAQGSLPAGLADGLTGVVVFGQLLLWLLLAAAHTGLRRRADHRPSPVGPTWRDAASGD